MSSFRDLGRLSDLIEADRSFIGALRDPDRDGPLYLSFKSKGEARIIEVPAAAAEDFIARRIASRKALMLDYARDYVRINT